MRNMLTVPSTARPLVPGPYEEIAVTGSVTTLTLANAQGCQRAVVRFENAQLRYTVDGKTTPTATVGWLANDMDEEVFSGLEAINLQMIRVGSTNAIARVQYLK